MLKIKRTAKRGEAMEEISSRGPFLTESEAFDAGWRRIVVKLEPLSLRMRFHRGKREWLVPYEELLGFARAREQKLKRLAKKQKQRGSTAG